MFGVREHHTNRTFAEYPRGYVEEYAAAKPAGIFSRLFG